MPYLLQEVFGCQVPPKMALLKALALSQGPNVSTFKEPPLILNQKLSFLL